MHAKDAIQVRSNHAATQGENSEQQLIFASYNDFRENRNSKWIERRDQTGLEIGDDIGDSLQRERSNDKGEERYFSFSEKDLAQERTHGEN